MRARPTPGHKLAGVSYGCSVRCECGWTSSTWYSEGARRNAYGEWHWHKEKCVAENSAVAK